MRRGPDRKSEFLRALKDEGTGELTTSSSPGTSGEVGRRRRFHQPRNRSATVGSGAVGERLPESFIQS